MNLKDFVNILKSKSENIEEFINLISLIIGYEKHNINTLLFKTGDLEEKFYIILHGSVTHLEPKEDVMELTEEEYMIYLIKLRKYEEFELLNKCIMLNRTFFRQDVNEFDKWLVKQQTLSPKRSLKGQKLHFVKELKNALLALREDIDFGKSTFGRKSSNNLNVNDKLISIYKDMTVDDYVNRIKPIITLNNAERSKYTVYTYHVIAALNHGSIIGDLTFLDKNKKRQGSVIITEETHLAILDKVSFNNCLKTLKEKEITSKLNILTSMNCFCTFSKPVFNKKYLNLFVFMHTIRGTQFMKQGDIADNIFFLIEGEFEIKFRGSLLEIKDLIKEFGGQIEVNEEDSMMIGTYVII